MADYSAPALGALLGRFGSVRYFAPPPQLEDGVQTCYTAQWNSTATCLCLLPDLRSHLLACATGTTQYFLLLPPRQQTMWLRLKRPAYINGVVTRPGVADSLLKSFPVKHSTDTDFGAIQLELAGGIPHEWNHPDWTVALNALQKDLLRSHEQVGSLTKRLCQALLRTTMAMRGRVPELADHMHMHQRTLTRHIRKRLTLNAKQALRIERLRKAITRIIKQGQHNSTSSLVDLALDLGYFDQAHLNKDFRELAQTTPEKLRCLLAQDPDYPSLLDKLGCLPCLPQQATEAGAQSITDWPVEQSAKG